MAVRTFMNKTDRSNVRLDLLNDMDMYISELNELEPIDMKEAENIRGGKARTRKSRRARKHTSPSASTKIRLKCFELYYTGESPYCSSGEEKELS